MERWPLGSRGRAQHGQTQRPPAPGVTPRMPGAGLRQESGEMPAAKAGRGAVGHRALSTSHSSPFLAGWMLSSCGFSSSDPSTAPCCDPAASPTAPSPALPTVPSPPWVPWAACPVPGQCSCVPSLPCLATGQHHGQTQPARTVGFGVIRLLLLRRGIIFIIIILRRGESVCKRSDGPAECLCVSGLCEGG